MLHSISFHNFKRFERFSIFLQKGNIVVGANNSGKSSILDALRILAGCLRFAKTRTPRQFMIWGESGYGYEVPDSSVSVPLENITNNYSEDDACPEFKHENGGIIRICLHPSRITRCVFFSEKRPPLSSKAFLSAFPVDFVIVPTLSPFEDKELYVRPETVRANEQLGWRVGTFETFGGLSPMKNLEP